ncbi:MAG: family 43 glycosylhydrolase [Clostridia bacterium]|nr:family 43 glycosylhydrolase [Clostridia bacterium]
MKLNFKEKNRSQPDPFIFEDEGKYYLYVTAGEGVEAYMADDPFGEWSFYGIVTAFREGRDFWAPSVIRVGDTYYMYVSCDTPGTFQNMHVAKASSPLGPFADEKRLYDHFSIDSHTVQTEAGLFLWYAKDNLETDKVGTRIFIDRLIDPYTPANQPKEVVVPDFDEEKFTPQCTPERDWYTIEGPLWFTEGEWQYVMYSGGCYRDDTYHLGYAAAKSTDPDLTRVDFVKATEGGKFSPLIIKNDFEEGVGHHSVLKYKGEYYAVYHGRDYGERPADMIGDGRTARICKLTVKDGVITAERYQDRV